MKKRLLFLGFFILLPIVFAQDWVFNSQYIEVNLGIASKIMLIPTSSNYRIQYVIVNLSFVPQNGFQEEVLDTKFEPLSEKKEGSVIFRWDSPEERELDFSLKSNIRSYNKIMEVKNKVKFPLNNLPDDVIIYTNPSGTIDSDDKEVIRKASEIIKGEDDLYIIVFKLGEWTKENIDYDLSTLTEGVNQKASWVLQNREGVCDELTNLFIAMNRALGIPAKFVSGVAYTNAKEFEEGFGPHGWAEVYFPGYGWIPFDVTYGEFGFVDASHIKLKEGLDADDASTKFQWFGKDIEIKTYPLDVKAEVKEIKGRLIEPISIDARAVKDNIGFGSYNLIEANIKNLNDYYKAAELILSKSREVEIIGEEKKILLLNPNEEKKVYWIVKVSDNLERGYMYTFPFMVNSLRNVTAGLRFNAVEDGKRFSLEGLENLIREKEEEKNYLGNVELGCKTDKDEIYEYESIAVECNIKNIGNIYLDKLNVCIGKDCKELNLGITQEDKINFDFKPKKVGAQEIVVEASNKDISKSTFFDITVYDKPSIEISDIVFPQEVEYRNKYEISFMLNKNSIFAPYNVSIRIEPLKKEWELSQLKENRRFVLSTYGSNLNVGENRFKILIRYKDKNGEGYETSKDFNISLVNVNILQRIILFFRGLFK